jgi:flagellar biosynthesis/type III secretory pathway chaperone
MMEPQVCLTQLANMLADETRLLGTLAQQLQHEHELLVANDVEGLEQAADARQASVAGLARVDHERRSLCRLLGYGADNTGLAAMLKWCDPSGSLAAPHAAASQEAQRCREHNDRNGALVNARLNRLNSMVDRMNGSNHRTYESRGPSRTVVQAPPGRMVSISA